MITRKHVVFVIDASRSMIKCDVIDHGTHKKRRIDAVLDACFEFIKVRFQYELVISTRIWR